MAVIKAVSSRASIGHAVNYVTKEEKTEERLISGKDCNPQTAIDEMKATKEIWGKTDGREYYHFVQSFSPEEMITPQEAHVMAKELAEQRFNGYEVVMATHQDRDHIHTHFIVNSVNHEDGYKLHWSKFELQKMKEMSNGICHEHGKNICEFVKSDEITAYSINKYKVLEKSIIGQEYKSYILDCYKAVNSARATATSREDFISKMKENGFETNWSDTRKHVTFMDKDGNKIRNSNLEKTFKEPFGKEDLEHGFEINIEAERIRERARDTVRDAKQSRAFSTDTGLEHGAGGSPAEDTDLAIAKLTATIDQSKAAVNADDRAKADRISDEQGRQRERDRAAQQTVIERSRGSQGYER